MKETMLLFFFTFSFLFIAGVFFLLILRDRRIERRVNYYFDINKKYKDFRKNKEKVKDDYTIIKRINESIRDRLPTVNQEKNENILKSAGVNLNPEEYVMLKWFLTAIIGGILYFLSDNLIFLALGGIIGYVSPKVWVDRKRNKRIQKFNDGLSDMITTTIGSLRSGYSFPQALKTVSEECESPIKEEVEIVLKEMNYGVTMEEALNNFVKRMPSGDLELMIQAILIQRQVGGNLASVLEIIVRTIRDRNKIQRQVQTLTSQGRLSGRVIGALPVVLGFAIYLINPDYMNALFKSTIGIIVITAGIVSGIIGFLLINKLTKIEV